MMPMNGSGCVYSRNTMGDLSDVCAIADEAFAKSTYDERLSQIEK